MQLFSARHTLILIAALAVPLQAAPLQIGADAREDLTLTVYSQNLGLVRDTRRLPPLVADQPVTIEDVSRRMQTETLSIRGAGTILEQNLNTNLVSHQALLQYYLGQELSLARRNPASGDESLYLVTLLSVDGDRALVRRNEHVESVPLNDDWRFIFPQLPPHLTSKPSLEFRTRGTDSATATTFSYLTEGLSWQMDYVLNLDDSSSRMSLEGLATLNNETGVDFRDAGFQLLAGTLNQPTPVAHRKAAVEMMAMAADTGAAPPEAFQDYHLYSLPQRTSLLDRQQKQLPLVSIESLPVKREYRHEFLVVPRPDSQRHQSAPQTWLLFSNDAGQPLPAGAVRSFSPDSDGRMQFIGGGRIDHTASGEEVELLLGEAFDLSIERQQTLFSKEYDGQLLEYEVLVRNSGDKAKELQLAVNFAQPWELQHSNLPMETQRGGRAAWALDVPAGDKAVLRFRVKLKKP